MLVEVIHGDSALIEGDVDELADLIETITEAIEGGEAEGMVLHHDGVIPLTIRRNDG